MDFGTLHFCGTEIANFVIAQKLAFSAFLTLSNIMPQKYYAPISTSCALCIGKMLEKSEGSCLSKPHWLIVIYFGLIILLIISNPIICKFF